MIVSPFHRPDLKFRLGFRVCEQANLYSALTQILSLYSLILHNAASAALSDVHISTQSQVLLGSSNQLFCLFLFQNRSYLHGAFVQFRFLLTVLTANCFHTASLIQCDTAERHDSARLPVQYTGAPANWP